MAVLLFPGQGSQSVGMGKALYDENDTIKALFHQADEILGFSLSDTMFNGTEEDLKQTSVTQPAVFLDAYSRYLVHKDNLTPKAFAGHSLGEFTALVASGVLSFEDGLDLVAKRSRAMQGACDNTKGTMAAILGMEDKEVEEICNASDGVVVAANYNCPGQLVISGEIDAIEGCVEKAKEAGARRAIILNVNGAFHSPLMGSAKSQLEEAILSKTFKNPIAPIYQNVNAKAETEIEQIKLNLIDQLTSPVKWTQTMKNMIDSGHNEFIEFGARVLSGFFKKVDRSLNITQH